MKSGIVGRSSPIGLCERFLATSGRPHVFPIRNPAIVSMTVAFIVGIVASRAFREPAADALFDDEKRRTYLGIGAE